MESQVSFFQALYVAFLRALPPYQIPDLSDVASMNSFALGALAVVGAVAQADIYTATASASVAAAQATAKTSQPASHVPGKVGSHCLYLS